MWLTMVKKNEDDHTLIASRSCGRLDLCLGRLATALRAVPAEESACGGCHRDLVSRALGLGLRAGSLGSI